MLTESLSAELEALLRKTKEWGPGVYVRLRRACLEFEKWSPEKLEREPSPITTIEKLRTEFKEDPFSFRRIQNFGPGSFKHLRRLLEGDEKAMPTPKERIEHLEEALHQIVDWSEAYPLKVFPEPDWRKAAELLAAGGIMLDAVSAHNMRHVIEGVGKIAKEALEP